MKELNLSKAFVTSYLPYEKGVYFPAETDSSNISVGAERIRGMRKRENALEKLRIEQSEEALWAAVLSSKTTSSAPIPGWYFPSV